MIRIVKMHFYQGNAEKFIQLFEEVYPAISSCQGCKHLRLLRDKKNTNIFFTYSIWESEENLNAYRNSDLFATTWEKTKAMFAEKAEAWSVEEM
ncbi:MAG: antibiotic biosynthesis monooxygenase [Bacteroidetes bacterium]|nr:antibiotic biosynthesis monooxygenase [Bacteroidota bacterium]